MQPVVRTFASTHHRAGSLIAGLLVLVLAAVPAAAQQRVTYEVAFPNAAHHEAEVTATFTGVPQGQPLEVRMSRTSPGRYALHEFAKNVYGVDAVDGQGRPLTVTRPNLHQWDVAGHDGTVRVRYTLFGNRADGTYTGITNRYAHLNMPATFMWARGFEAAPVEVTFHRPDSAWDIATQLYPTEDPEVFTAPDFHYFIDSPTHIGDIDWRTWEVTSSGETYTIRLAVNHEGTDAELDAYAGQAQQVVAEQIAVFGETPDYGPGTYTFIAAYLPYVAGDGMEHRNSTILTSTRPLSTGMLGNLGTLSHEYFHAWNVERIRPASLEPFDFEAANMSGELWFAEGFTSYYTPLFIRRAGIMDDAQYARSLSGTIDAVVNSPGRAFFSPVEMSRQAPFVDAATSVDPQNRENTFISYYTWGSGIGLGLDLTLRSRYDVTLDDYMRAMWEQYGEPETPYTHTDLIRVLGEVTGDPAFAASFFAQYIEGREAVDYEALLAHAGFLLRTARPGAVWLGAPVEDRDGRAVVAGRTLIGSPLYEAGLDRGDVLLRIDGHDVAGAAYVQAVLDRSTPGETITIAYEQNGIEQEAQVTLAQDPRLEVIPYEEAGRPLTDEMKAFRASWLGSRAPK